MTAFFRFLIRSCALTAVLIVLAGAQCNGDDGASDESSAAAEQEESQTPAADRLKEGRNVYDGNINDNLDQLEQDLEATGAEREQRIDEQSP